MAGVQGQHKRPSQAQAGDSPPDYLQPDLLAEIRNVTGAAYAAVLARLRLQKTAERANQQPTALIGDSTVG